ncbi:SPC24 isoform 7, partial [Pan troglodytes]
DIEDVSQGLLSLLGANRAEAQQRRLLGRHEQVVERLLETQDGAEKQLRGTWLNFTTKSVKLSGIMSVSQGWSKASIMAPVWPSPSTWTAPSSPGNSSATTSGVWWTPSGSQEPRGCVLHPAGICRG